MSRPIKVLHIASGDLWAGAEVQAFTLIAHLARIANTEVAAVLMNEGMLAERLRSAGISTCVLDERRTGSARLIIRLWHVLRSERPDVIHTHREKENILGSLANRLCERVPSVRTVHGSQEHGGARGWQGIRRRGIDMLDNWCGRILQGLVIAVTEELGEHLASRFSGKVAVVENGVDADSVRTEQGVADFRCAEPRATHIGIVGRLAQVKRIDLFLEAASLLTRAQLQREWRFHVFGDGPLRMELEKRTEELRIRHVVTFHGHRRDIATCIGGLDGLVISSDHEGLPMTALEAAALGIPTAAHAVGGLRDVVPEEFLVTRHDAIGYRDGILRVLQADAREITKTRAELTLERFSARRNAERIRLLYEQLISRERVIDIVQ